MRLDSAPHRAASSMMGNWMLAGRAGGSVPEVREAPHHVLERRPEVLEGITEVARPCVERRRCCLELHLPREPVLCDCRLHLNALHPRTYLVAELPAKCANSVKSACKSPGDLLNGLDLIW